MSLKEPYTTSYVLAIAMFVLSVAVCKIFTVEICMALTLTLTLNELRSNVNMPTERTNATIYVLAIAIFFLSIIVGCTQV